jgi:hypothetical protein
MEDRATLHIEEVRTGRKEPATVSMKKCPAAKDFDAMACTLPSNAQSDGGNGTMIVGHPRTDESEAESNPEDILHQNSKSVGVWCLLEGVGC